MKSSQTKMIRARSKNHWKLEQPQLKQAQETAMLEVAQQASIDHDRRNKFTKRQHVGRIALGGLANTIIFAHNTKVLTKSASALLGSDTHAAIVRKGEAAAPSLRQKYELSRNSEMAPSRLRRLGNLALKASLVVTEAVTRRSRKRASHLDEKSNILYSDFTQKKSDGRLISMARAYKLGSAEEKRRGKDERANVADQAVLKYREEHPEVAIRELKEQEALLRNNALVSLESKRDYAINYFQNKSVYSFSKAIPRRPHYEGEPGFSGDYAELAKATVSSALAYKAKDGTIPLMGSRLEQIRLTKGREQYQSMYTACKAEDHYSDGVSTTLWQLGFVQFEKESDIPYGRGNYNPAIEWEEAEKCVKARIAFDPTNELHQLLASNEDAGANRMIELEMSQRQYGYNQQPSYLKMRTVEPVPAALVA
ncbi:hypothetical protein H7171_00930 [Candidatus Saccharibacteria bacterium]|nr:hypothetical protein [Candidatus Saccharibacteria bacterium]